VALSQRLLRRVIDGLLAPSGSLIVFNAQGKLLTGAVANAGQVRVAPVEDLADIASFGLAGWVAQHGKPVLVADTSDESRWLRQPWEDLEGLSRSVICVPVLASRRVAAVLTLVRPRPGGFTLDDLKLLSVVADCMGPAYAKLLNILEV
jgi:GAF domain-containing protein